MRRLSAALALLAAGALVGCAAHPYDPGLFRAQFDTPYQLASGDRVRVIVFGQDSLSNSFSVDPAGNVSMPLIGLVKAYGLTTADLEGVIAARLRNGYIRDPRVSVEVEAFRPFFVLGEVTTAGQYPYVSGLTVQSAIAIAGGFSPRGYQAGADVTRMINGRLVTAFEPLAFPVRPGDTITIRERFF
jgi:polysaccharide export outer membrane protein